MSEWPAMHPALQQLFAERRIVVTDGAWGTQLQARGLAIDEFPDNWNLTHPSEVTAVARDYVEAGSAVILTNTFGANRLRLQEYGLAEKLEQINRAGVEISLQAAAGRARVFASIGPTGKLLLNGDATVEQMRDFFSEQARALASAGADGLVVETMSDLQEARAAVLAACETNLPVVACMVFDSGKAHDRTMMGHTPEQVAEVLTEAGADVIGANCGQGIAGFVGICQRLRATSDRPIWIKANAGLPAMVDGRAQYQVTAQEFSSFIPALIAAGASFVGGCCGTTPAFIHAVAASVKTAAAHQQPNPASAG